MADDHAQPGQDTRRQQHPDTGADRALDAAKAQDQKFNPFRLFGGAKKTLVGEGV